MGVWGTWNASNEPVRKFAVARAQTVFTHDPRSDHFLTCGNFPTFTGSFPQATFKINVEGLHILGVDMINIQNTLDICEVNILFIFYKQNLLISELKADDFRMLAADAVKVIQ